MKNGHRFLSLVLVLIFCLFFTVSASAQTPTPTPETGTVLHGDKFVMGDTFRLKSGEVIEGNLAVIGSTVTIEKGSTVNGDIVLAGGTISIDGTVNGNIVAAGGAVNIGETAVIDGDVAAIGASLKQSPAARISGQVSEQAPIQWDFKNTETTPAQARSNTLQKFLSAAFESLALAALAVVLALIFPEQMKRVSETLNGEPVISGGVGLLTIIGVPIILVIMTITIILIPVMILSVLVLALTFIYSWVVVGFNIGQHLSKLFKSTWPSPVSAGIGVLLLSLVVGTINLVPCVGWILGFIIMLVGLGAVVISRFGSTRYAIKNSQIVINLQDPPVSPAQPQPPVANG